MSKARRKGQVCVATVALVVLTALSVGSAQAEDIPGVALDPFGKDFFLEERECEGSDAIPVAPCDMLARNLAQLPGHRGASFSEVTAQLPRQLRSDCGVRSQYVGWPTRWIRCFDAADTGGSSLSWLSQGIAGTGEWRTSQTPGGRDHYLVASWCYRGRGFFVITAACSGSTETRTRISIISVERNGYRHVDLKLPYANGSTAAQRHLGLHAGGTAIAGQWLYVADTDYLYQFNLNFFIRDSSGSYSLPVWNWYSITQKDRQDYSVFSSISIDGSGVTPVLVGAEYKAGSNAKSLVTRWPLDGEGAIDFSSGFRGIARSLDSYLIDNDSSIDRVQGAAAWDGIYLFSESLDEIERTPAGRPRRARDRCIVWGFGIAEDLYASEELNLVVGINEQPYVRSFWAVHWDDAFGISEPSGYPRRRC